MTQFRYDRLGRLVKVIDALNQETSYTYDELGNRLTQKDANYHVTGFEYDMLGRELSRTLPDGAAEHKTYDAAGNLATRTDFLGRVTNYGYDINNRLTSRTAACGACEKADASWTYTPTGRRATASYQIPGATPGTFEAITDAYTYDTRDRVSSVIASGSSGPRSNLTYTYDANSSRLTMTSMVGGTTTAATYAYDDAGRLDTVTDILGRVYDLSYDAVGNRTGLAYPNGATTTYAYNALNRLTNLSTLRAGSPIQVYAFTLGPTGNRTQIVELDKAKVYMYDDLYRLTGEQVIGGTAYSKTFGYDPVGNRQAQITAGSAGSVVVPGTVNYSYDSRDRLLTENGTVYGYDANGNVVAKSGDATYTWDTENRLVRIAKADGTVIEHAYDADGVRIRTRTTPAGGAPQITNFLVDTSGGLSHVVAELGPAGLQTAYYLRALDDLLAVIRPTGTRYYHADGIGSVRKLTDESGAVTDNYEYTAFGEQYEHVGMDPQPYAFAGEPLDPNSGFQYHRARWMQSSAGRFVGMDPFVGATADPASLHRYLYAGQRPTFSVDPSGQSEFTIGGVSVSLSVSQTLSGIATIATGTVFGALGGAGDAFFAEGDVVDGALKGALVGAFLGPLGRIRALQRYLITAGLALAATGSFEAFLDDDPGLGLYRGIVFVAGVSGVISALGGRSAGSGNVVIYQSRDPSTGQVIYVGITDNLAARAAAHLRTKGITIQRIAGLPGLDRSQARGVEQALINYYGLGKNQGSLMNKINSIARTNPAYSRLLARGHEVLRSAGYPGF